jgi:hypothetical protein
MPDDLIPIQRLRDHMAACRVSLHWFGVRRALTNAQKARAAETFGAESTFLSAGKRLFDTRDTTYRKLSSVRTQAINFWHSVTVPFPEPGIRLIRREEMEAFGRQMKLYAEDLEKAAKELDDHYVELKKRAKEKLGDLYNSRDYPESLSGMFQIEWDFPNIEPPNYLQRLSPQLYREEQAKVARRFEEAVRLTEQAFINEFHGLISHLSERLAVGNHGEKKIFRDSAVDNLNGFFGKFRNLNITNNQELDRLVGQAQALVHDLAPDDLRNNLDLRKRMAGQLIEVQTQLDALMIDRPRRNLVSEDDEIVGAVDSPVG